MSARPAPQPVIAVHDLRETNQLGDIAVQARLSDGDVVSDLRQVVA